MNNDRPTFGVTNKVTTTTKKAESGAIWKRQSKKTNSDFLSIRLTLNKEKLKELLAKDGDSVNIGFVAFPNPYKNEGEKRPDFRIFEDNEE